MDSGNSGSMQSSSGGDEEYDSRAESISVFLNNHVGPMSNPPPPPSNHHFHHHQSSSSSMFDPLSNYFDPLSSSISRSPQHFTNPNSLLHLDLLNWSKNIRSDTNCADLGAFIASSSPTQQFFASQPPQSRPSFASASVQIPQGQGSGSGSGPALSDQTNNNTGGGGGGNAVRNPKKRSRASRRAPTTVLTTDTTNFRAMVQEFTGIPAPPFTSSSSPFPRSRLDLFGTSSTFRSATHFESPSPPPSYLLRPFAQKIQQPPPPFLSSSSSSSTSASTTINTTCSSSSSSSSSSSMVDAIVSTTTNVNSDLGLLNPLLNFHPLFQPCPKFPFSNSAMNIKGQENNSLEIPASDSHLKMGVFEDFGLGHGGAVNTNLSGLQHRSENNWGGDEGDDQDHGHGLFRSINASNNYTASASDYDGGDKGSENVAVATRRSEGMNMESWICSSD